MFNIGDKVKVIKDQGRFLKAGEICSVIDIDNDMDWIALKSIKPSLGDGCWNTHIQNVFKVKNNNFKYNPKGEPSYKGTPPSSFDSNVPVTKVDPLIHCVCYRPKLKTVNTSVGGGIDSNNTFLLCELCKKERLK